MLFAKFNLQFFQSFPDHRVHPIFQVHPKQTKMTKKHYKDKEAKDNQQNFDQAVQNRRKDTETTTYYCSTSSFVSRFSYGTLKHINKRKFSTEFKSLNIIIIQPCISEETMIINYVYLKTWGKKISSPGFQERHSDRRLLWNPKMKVSAFRYQTSSK